MRPLSIRESPGLWFNSRFKSVQKYTNLTLHFYSQEGFSLLYGQ